MPLELTPKQEKFCQKYIELGDATKAYYAAYDAKNSKPVTATRRAKDLMDNGKVAARIRALREMGQERHLVTVDSITRELEEARRLALDTDQVSAAVTASMGKAKLHGYLVDKAEVSGKDGAPIRFTLAIGGNAKGD